MVFYADDDDDEDEYDHYMDIATSGDPDEFDKIPWEFRSYDICDQFISNLIRMPKRRKYEQLGLCPKEYWNKLRLIINEL
jgi:hypothetical protein